MMKDAAIALLALGVLFLAGCPYQAGQVGAIAVWQSEGDNGWDIWYSLWDDSAAIWWTPGGGKSDALAIAAGDDHDPYVDSDGKDTALASWSHKSSGSSDDLTPAGDSDIYYSWFNGNSNSWTPPLPLAHVSGADADPASAMSGNGDALAIWVHTNSDGSNTLYYSAWDGTRWSVSAPIDDSIISVSLPELAYSPANGGYFAAWVGMGQGGPRVKWAVYKGGTWSPASEVPGQSKDAIWDTSVPTDARIGLAASDKTAKAAIVWAVSGGGLYSSTWDGTSWGRAVNFGDTEMPDVEYDAGAVAHALAIQKRDLASSGAIAAPGSVSPVPGTGSDFRPAITFIDQRKIGLGVFWTTSVSPSDIYYTRYQGGWSAVAPIDPGRSYKDRNPDVSPLIKLIEEYEFDFTYCGDKVLQAPNSFGQMEECEVGIACPKANEWCDVRNCLCEEIITPNRTWCGDAAIQRPNDDGIWEQCEVGIKCPPGETCRLRDCKCIPGDDIPPEDGEQPPEDGPQPPEGYHFECFQGMCTHGEGEGENECISNDDCRHYECEGDACTEVMAPGEDSCRTDEDCFEESDCGNGEIDSGEECDIGGGMKADGSYYGAAKDTCGTGERCSECECIQGIIPPECGDGYISDPPHGATEECDVGGNNGVPLLPDTCPPPLMCILCHCQTEEDLPGEKHLECVGGYCQLVQGAGESTCHFNAQCRHYACEGTECVEKMTPGYDECYSDRDCGGVSECGDGEIDWDEECEHDLDCPVGYDCIDCECVESGRDEGYCGDGIIDYQWEDCEYDQDCPFYPDEYCIGCQCVESGRDEGYCGDGIVQEEWEQCEYDQDCGEGMWCIDCYCYEVPAYCGDGILDPGEECEYDYDCDGGVCSQGCTCVYPPSLNCNEVCSATPGADVLGHGLASSSDCGKAAEAYYEAPMCYTTCTYSWFYKVTNIAGYDSCCCGMVKRFPCTNCPCVKPCDTGCPDKDVICPANAPSWVAP